MDRRTTRNSIRPGVKMRISCAECPWQLRREIACTLADGGIYAVNDPPLMTNRYSDAHGYIRLTDGRAICSCPPTQLTRAR